VECPLLYRPLCLALALAAVLVRERRPRETGEETGEVALGVVLQELALVDRPHPGA